MCREDQLVGPSIYVQRFAVAKKRTIFEAQSSHAAVHHSRYRSAELYKILGYTWNLIVQRWKSACLKAMFAV